MILGLVSAFAAAVAYGVSSILQSRAARSIQAVETLDPRLLVRLARSLPFVVGSSLDLVGFAASLLALRTLPLFLVQSAVASSIGVTALVAAVLGVRLTRRQVCWLVGLGSGLVLLAAAAQPEAAAPLPLAARWALLLACVPIAGAGALAAHRWSGRASVGALAACAGLAFGVVALAARALRLPDPSWHALADPALWAIAAGGLLGILLFSVALQRGLVTTATAVTFAVETVVPSLLGLAFLGDSARPGLGILAVVGFAAAVGGATGLALSGDAPDGAGAPRAHPNPGPPCAADTLDE